MKSKKKEEDNQNMEASKSEIGWGHQIRSYVLQPYRLVKDNRTNFESSSPDKVFNGEIDDFLEQSFIPDKMNKIILRFFILIFLILLVFIVYLSTVGIKTKRFNDQISSQIKNIDENLDIKLKDIFIVLDPLKFKLKVKTLGVDLDYKNKTIELESINSEISIKSYFNNKFSLDELNISTKSIEIKDLISFVGVFNNDPKIFIARKIIKKGYLIANVDLKFDENGKIKDNFKINGLLKNGKIDFFEKNNLSQIDLNFNVEKKKFK